MSILVVGDAIRDRWVMAERSERPDPATGAPIHRVAEERRGPGGAAMVAAMVGALGEEVEFLTVAPPGDESCTLPGIVVRAINCGRPTPLKERIVIDGIPAVRLDREQTLDVSVKTTAMMLGWAVGSDADYCVVADYGKGVVTRGLAVGLVATFGRRLIVDPGPAQDWRIWDGCGVIKCNARQFASPQRPPIGDLDIEALVVTRGHDGVEWYAGQRHETRRGCPVVDVDPTGCGDQFLAGLAVELSRGSVLADAIETANELAARQAAIERIKPVEIEVYAGHP